MKAKTKKSIILLLTVAIILCSLLFLGASTDWFGLYGPGGKIMTASALAMSAGDLTLQIDANVGSFDTETLLVKMHVDVIHKDVTIAAMSKSGIIQWAVFDSHLIWRAGLRYQAKDISVELEQLWDSVDLGTTPDWEGLIRSISPKLAQSLEGHVEYDAISGSLFQLYRCFNDTSWTEERAGLQIEKKLGSTCYRFQPNTYTLLTETLSCFRDVCTDPQDHQKLQDSLDEVKGTLEALHYQAEITTQWGVLSQLRFQTTVNEKAVGIDIQILDRNDTQLPEQELSDLLSQATSN